MPAARPAPVSAPQLSVRQRLGTAGYRGGGGATDVSQMPPLVLPPPEQTPLPPPPASYRPPASANGPPPPAQYNGAAGRPTRPDVRFERAPAPALYERESVTVQFDREPPPARYEAELVPDSLRGPPRGGLAGPGGPPSGPPPLAGLGIRRSFSQR